MNALLFALSQTPKTDYALSLPGGETGFTFLLAGLTVGAWVACLLSLLVKRHLGAIFDQLRQKEADRPEKAVPGAELGLARKRSLCRQLCRPASVPRKLLHVVLPDGRILPPLASLDDDPTTRKRHKRTRREDVGPMSWEKPEECDAPLPAERIAPPDTPFCPEEASYYLDTVHRYRAEIRFAGRGHEGADLLLATAVLAAAFFLLRALFPAILSMMSSLLTVF